jgi:dipeptidyl aminopeptidase/acylaminoacyl peptidase
VGTGPFADRSSRVQAVADLFGPSDMTLAGDFSPFGRTIIRAGVGSSPAQLAAASAVNYVAPGDPPFMIMHGTADPLVSPEQSVRLAQRLTSARVPVTLVTVQGAGHGLDTAGQHPTPDQLGRTLVEFFGPALGA